MPEKTSNRMVKVTVISVIFIVILILLHLFLSQTVLRYTKKVKSEFKLVEARLNEQEQLIKSVPNPQKAIEDIENKNQEFKAMGVSKKQFPRIIQLLGRSTADYNIDVISIRPREDIKLVNESLPAGINKVYIEMILRCSYQGFGEYLKALNDMSIVFCIETLTIERKEAVVISSEDKKTPAGAKREDDDLKVTLLLSTYLVWEI
ncbi:MAG: hypothetical protein V2A64_03145 [Candidatus Omnitrophota bacterium]